MEYEIELVFVEMPENLLTDDDVWDDTADAVYEAFDGAVEFMTAKHDGETAAVVIVTIEHPVGRQEAVEEALAMAEEAGLELKEK